MIVVATTKLITMREGFAKSLANLADFIFSDRHKTATMANPDTQFPVVYRVMPKQ
jgi:hypothetical protein